MESVKLFGDPGKLSRLTLDIERIARGGGPTSEELSQAPVLTDWQVQLQLVPVLVGIVRGHPTVGPGPIATSQLFALHSRWARTMTRWYALDSKVNLDG